MRMRGSRGAFLWRGTLGTTRALLLAAACLQVALENGVQLSKGAHLLSRYATVKAAVASTVIIVSAAIAGALTKCMQKGIPLARGAHLFVARVRPSVRRRRAALCAPSLPRSALL